MIDGPAAGQRVKELMERRGWSLGTLADRSGVDKGHLSVMLRGRVPNPGVGTLRKLSDALGVSLSEITGEKPMPKRRMEITEGVARLPLRTLRVQADGHPSWDDTRDTIIVSSRAAMGRPNAFAAIVTGTCMMPTVMPGAVVLIDPDQKPTDGKMVVVTTDHGDTLVKWYRLDDDGQPYLRAADSKKPRPDRG